MTAPRTIYEHQLPPESDPEVVCLAEAWISEARGSQRPLRAMAYAIPSALVGVVLWEEINRWTGFDMHWYLMGGSAVALGALVGRPCRTLGALFDRRWAFVLGALGLAMALAGDLLAATALAAQRDGVPWSDVLASLGPGELGQWLSGRAPLDWVVAGFAAAGAGLAARPALDERQLTMQARIDVAAERLASSPQDEPDDGSQNAA